MCQKKWLTSRLLVVYLVYRYTSSNVASHCGTTAASSNKSGKEHLYGGKDGLAKSKEQFLYCVKMFTLCCNNCVQIS